MSQTTTAALIDKCVHCGFCLPTCPTYMLWGEEMDSPRGRIYLMKAALDGRTAIDATFVRHFDACLGCLNCVTACPSGVQYGRLIEPFRIHMQKTLPEATSLPWNSSAATSQWAHRTGRKGPRCS